MLSHEKDKMTYPGPDFATLHNRYEQKIRHYLERLVGEEESKDLTQEVFIRVNESLKTFRGEAMPSTWIYKIATNAALDRMRKNKRSRMLLPLDEGGEREDMNVWTGEIRATDQHVIRKEMNDCIRNIVSGLPETYRVVIVLSDIEGFKNEEMAQILGLSLETVKMRLHRARAKLKEELSRHCILYRDDRNELACDLKSEFQIIHNTERPEFRKDHKDTQI